MKKILLTAMVAVLCACGGGGSQTPPAPTPAPTPAPAPTPTPAPPPAGTFTSISVDQPVVVAGDLIKVNWTSTYTECKSAAGTLPGAGTSSVPTSTAGNVTVTVQCGNEVKSAAVEVLPATTPIPDQAFEQALVAMRLDDAVDGKIDTRKAMSVTGFVISAAGYQYQGYPFTSVAGNRITDLTGIENMRNLQLLRVDNQKVSTVNLSKLTKLRTLTLQDNPIATLDVSSNKQLELLGIAETAITTIDVRGLSSLAELNALNATPDTAGQRVPYTTSTGNVAVGLQSVIFGQNYNLTTVSLTGNRITSLDVSGLTNLKYLMADYNELTNLKVNQSTVVTVYAGNNKLQSLDISGTNIGATMSKYGFGVANNPGLGKVVVSDPARVSSWCAAASAAYAKSDYTYGGCFVDTGLQFVSQ